MDNMSSRFLFSSRWEPAVAVREENHHVLLAGHLPAALLNGEKAKRGLDWPCCKCQVGLVDRAAVIEV